MKNNRYYTHKNGYRQHYNPSSPDARKSGFSPVHRDVARKKYKRDIKPYEVVHHKDGNKLNNSWNNLEIMSRSKHSKLHQEQRAKANSAGCATIIAIITLCLIIMLGIIITGCSAPKDQPQEETTSNSEPEKIKISVASIEFDEKNKIITWSKNEQALSYAIKITRRQKDERGNYMIEEGTYEFLDEKRGIKETYYDVSHLKKGYYDIVVWPENDHNIYGCYGNQKFFTIE